MSDLVEVADAAYPFDYTRLPAAVKVVLGYVGQHLETPHVWTADEIATVHAHGLAWGPIWTPPQGHFTADDGLQAGDMMRDALGRLGYTKAGPVFLDIEKHTYDAHPADTRAGVSAWEATMVEGGWTITCPYLPTTAGSGWVADWTGTKPTSLPNAWDGQQYAGEVDGGRYDLSVFRSSIFTALLNQGDTTMSTLDAQDKAWIVAQLSTVQTNLHTQINACYTDNEENSPHPSANVHILAAVNEVLTAVKGIPKAEIDAKTLAADILVQLGPAVATDVAAELAKRLQA